MENAAAARLDAAFYAQDALTVAPLLVGARVCRRLDNGTLLTARITETEVYRGGEDGACHARSGRTPRTEMLYAPGGYAYVYLIYGLHWLFNVVTGPADFPQAVLIRALEAPLDGPAKWTHALSVSGKHNGLYLPKSQEIWLEEGDHPSLETAPRVGIAYAPEPWRSMPWRFIAKEGGK